jgi:heme/copper-type cytochrome/quinol oxidase subunit 3
MPTNLAVRLSSMSHTLIARNRKVRTQTGPWVKFLWAGLILASLIIFANIFWAYGNIRSTSLHYQISEAQEMQKQHLELNRKLRVELSNLKSIGRLEKLAETYEMGPPASGQVVKVDWP